MPFVPEPAEGGRLRRAGEQAQSSRTQTPGQVAPNGIAAATCGSLAGNRAECRVSRRGRLNGVWTSWPDRGRTITARLQGAAHRHHERRDCRDHRHATELSRAHAEPDVARQSGRRGAHVPLLRLCRPEGRQRPRGDDRRRDCLLRDRLRAAVCHRQAPLDALGRPADAGGHRAAARPGRRHGAPAGAAAAGVRGAGERWRLGGCCLHLGRLLAAAGG